jgi:hypothetical protein
MRRVFVALALLLALAPAKAQPLQHSCWPSDVLGGGTAATIRATPNGIIAVWHCLTPFTWVGRWEGVAKDYSGPSVGEIASEVARNGFLATWGVYNDQWTLGALALESEAFALLAQLRPPEPIWRVAGTTARATYLVVNEQLVKNGTVTVQGGTLCTCTAGYYAKATTYYCRFDATPAMAYCTKRAS